MYMYVLNKDSGQLINRYTCIPLTYSLVTCTYVGLYGIGLFNFVPAVTYPDLVHILFGFHILIENVFYYSFVLEMVTTVVFQFCITAACD